MLYHNLSPIYVSFEMTLKVNSPLPAKPEKKLISFGISNASLTPNLLRWFTASSTGVNLPTSPFT